MWTLVQLCCSEGCSGHKMTALEGLISSAASGKGTPMDHRTTLRIVPPRDLGFEDRYRFHHAFNVAGTFPSQIVARVRFDRQAELVDKIAAMIDQYARTHGNLLEVVDAAQIA